jgi:hypothetical protein
MSLTVRLPLVSPGLLRLGLFLGGEPVDVIGIDVGVLQAQVLQDSVLEPLWEGNLINEASVAVIFRDRLIDHLENHILESYGFRCPCHTPKYTTEMFSMQGLLFT